MGLQTFMRQFTIRLRMLGAVGFVLATLVAVGAVGWLGMHRLSSISDDFSHHAYSETVTFGKLRSAMNAAELQERVMVIKFANPDDLSKAEQAWKASLVQSRQAFNGMLEGEEDEDNPLVRENLKDLDAYEALVTPVVAKVRSGSYFTADSVAADMKPAEAIVERINARLEQINSIVAAEAAGLLEEHDAARGEALLMFGIAVLVGMVFVAPTTIANMNSICRPLDEAKRMASAIAKGDLCTTVKANGKDEINELMVALGDMQTSLVRIVNEVRGTTATISAASVEIASGNQDLSMRTEQAASNLQQTAASMDQINTTVQHSADSARQAADMAITNAAVATKGGQVVSQVVSTMDDIHHSSQKISDIIGVIDGIAFQTNILALNAAVEAARAGEQGRGFAVVAGEVRSLAQRSAEAARQIKTLIEASVEKVADGSRLVADAGTTIGEIVSNAGKVSDLINDIRRATDEQSSGMGQVNTAVGELDSMTQQNAALVEQSAAAATSLKDQAQRLSELVQVFKLP